MLGLSRNCDNWEGVSCVGVGVKVGLGVNVAVGVGVCVGKGVSVGKGGLVGSGVAVGARVCPGPQADSPRLKHTIRIIAASGRDVFINPRTMTGASGGSAWVPQSI